MSGTDSKFPRREKPAQAKIAAAVDDTGREDTFTRLRSALLEERLELMEVGSQNTGTDPYNSGIHRAMVKAHVWGKRSR